MTERLFNEIPTDPSNFLITQWSKDEFSFGSYSYLGIKATPHHRAILSQPIDNKLFFAGEATSTNHPGTIHGAFLEGQRAAREVLANGHKNIIVIGAGIAGLSAASFLNKLGISVTVLEGRSRIGGRILTSYDLGVPLEMGAMWIHGDSDQNPLIKLAQILDLNISKPQKTIQSLKSNIYNDSLENISSREILAAIHHYHKFVKKLRHKDLQVGFSLQDSVNYYLYLENLNRNMLSIFNLLIYINLEIPAAAPISKQSSNFSPEVFSFPGDNVFLPEGLSSIIDFLAKNIDIKINQIVHHIDYKNHEIYIKTSQGEFQSTALIITVPLGVLKKNIVQFSPALPSAHLNSINCIEFGSFEKIFLKYNTIPRCDKNHFIVTFEELSFYLLFTNLSNICSYPVFLVEGTCNFLEYISHAHFIDVLSLTNSIVCGLSNNKRINI